MKALFATLSFVAFSTAAVAAPTQFQIPAGQKSQAEVRAEIAQPSRMIDHGEATNFTIPQGERTRADAVAEIQSERNARAYADSAAQRMAAERRLYVGG